MAGLLPGDPSHHGIVESGPYSLSHDKLEELDHSSSKWYFCRKEIEENSPSRRDGIDLKKETYFRKSYCTFLQDLGMRLKVPQVTIATAIIFCHRFFLRQSHAKNDRRTIATVCMFLAGKVEETPRPLKDVILVSYEIIHKKDPAAVQRIKQKETYEQQKELILLGERVVLATLGFDLNVHHPYKPLVEAIKKFKVAQNALAQVAWNFVNDGLRTSLCLQFKPYHIAAGAIFLAAKFLKVKLPSDGEKVWWQEFDVTPRQLEEVSNQMLELYEQNRTVQSSHGSEIEGSMGGGSNHQAPAKTPAIVEESVSGNGYSQTSARPVVDQSYPDNQSAPQRTLQNPSNEYPSEETRSGGWDHEVKKGGSKDLRHHEAEQFLTETTNRSKSRPERPVENAERNESGEAVEARELKDGGRNSGYCPPDVITKIDKDKVKAALEKRKKFRSDPTRKTDLMDEDDLIERELENGIELAAEDEKTKQQSRRQSWSKPLYRLPDLEDPISGIEGDNDTGVKSYPMMKEEQSSQSKKRSRSFDTEELGGHRTVMVNHAEEGELSEEFRSPKLSSSPLAETIIKQRHDDRPFSHASYHNRPSGRGPLDYGERDHHKRHKEGHV
ncbi:cyclin-T1-3-like isoform X1 [Tasmannia lanceolata]|uniref:cyclin-T1-3-like isoform X1 n=2 Tax=Tasmannia lanceolata TaxID=3420 RepID=UPI00406432CE